MRRREKSYDSVGAPTYGAWWISRQMRSQPLSWSVIAARSPPPRRRSARPGMSGPRISSSSFEREPSERCSVNPILHGNARYSIARESPEHYGSWAQIRGCESHERPAQRWRITNGISTARSAWLPRRVRSQPTGRTHDHPWRNHSRPFTDPGADPLRVGPTAGSPTTTN